MSPTANGRLIVFAGPSGSGKTTVARAILKRHPDMVFSVSATTRSPRPGEEEGKNYFFLSKDEFQSRLANDEFIEWQRVYDDLYGSLKKAVEVHLNRGTSVVFDIDVRGALTIKGKYGPRAILIFVRPPSFETLESRLRQRDTEGPEELRKRLERAAMELEKAGEFDYIISNDILTEAIAQADAVVSAVVANASAPPVSR